MGIGAYFECSVLDECSTLLFEVQVPAFDGDSALAGWVDGGVFVFEAGEFLHVPEGEFADRDLFAFEPVHQHV